MHASKRSKWSTGGTTDGVHHAAAATAADPAPPLPGRVVGALVGPSAASCRAPSAAPAHRFLSHVLMLAASQITRETGFTHTRQSNIRIMAEVAAKYIESVGAGASAACMQAGRSEVNAHDILFGLSEMGLDFSEIRQWKELSEPAPFAHCMPPFPIAQPVLLVEPTSAEVTGAGATGGATAAAAASAATPSTLFPPRPPSVPLCLPAFPPRRTYAHTADLVSGRAGGSGAESSAATRKRKVEQNRQLESALVTLHQAAAKAAFEQAQVASKAAMEEAQLLAQQELRLQEAILARPTPSPPAVAPAANAAPAAPAIAAAVAAPAAVAPAAAPVTQATQAPSALASAPVAPPSTSAPSVPTNDAAATAAPAPIPTTDAALPTSAAAAATAPSAAPPAASPAAPLPASASGPTAMDESEDGAPADVVVKQEPVTATTSVATAPATASAPSSDASTAAAAPTATAAPANPATGVPGQ